MTRKWHLRSASSESIPQSRAFACSLQSGGSVKSVAEKAGITPGAAAVLLYRIRKSLLECIQGKLAKEHKT